MSRATSTVLAFLILSLTALPVAADEPKAGGAPSPQDQELVATTGEPEIVPGEVVVKWRDAPRGLEIAKARGLAIVAELGAPGADLPLVVSTGGRAVEEVLSELRADPAVAYAEPNYRVQLANDGAVAAVGVNDPLTAGQYSLDRMRVRDAWSLSRGGAGLVAVLDTGVQFNHPDLTGRLVAGYDFVSNDTDASDDNGHGTWVSGIIAANANDGFGIAGISWSDKILPVKIMNSAGTGDTSDLSSGIIYAADRGASVINMSVGGFPYAQYLQDAVNYAWSKGTVLVGAAGNNRREETFFPASFNNVVSVSATQVEDEFSHWSSWGPKVDVSAPGSSVQTTNCTSVGCVGASWGTHTYISGTSFATPNVAGVVALIRARYPSYTPAQVVSRLTSTVDDLGYAGYDTKYGYGRVNAYRALGATVTGPGPSAGDALEPNNALVGARLIGIDTTTRPSLHPAGDVDVFAVDVPRAGRLDVHVTGVVDTRAYPWNGSAIPIDPIVELYNTSGSLLVRVDNQWESGTEVASVTITASTRVLIRVSNWYANGNRAAYSVTPWYVDTGQPSASFTNPTSGGSVHRLVNPMAIFSEPVIGVSGATFYLRDVAAGTNVSVGVTYDAATRQARLAPTTMLAPAKEYRLELTAGITDTHGNALIARGMTFTTGSHLFADTLGNQFVGEIDWLRLSGITSGCSIERFCPLANVTRQEMAAFLARALELPAAPGDYFTDDASSLFEADINRIAAAGITTGCGAGRFCPLANVTRQDMAAFLTRALRLPATTRDYFSDDETSPFEAEINRIAAAGITNGCGDGRFCPMTNVTRQEMAAFLYRAFAH